MPVVFKECTQIKLPLSVRVNVCASPERCTQNREQWLSVGRRAGFGGVEKGRSERELLLFLCLDVALLLEVCTWRMYLCHFFVFMNT